MRARFKSYALAADGGPLKIDSYYGNDDAAVQKEYERRTKQVVDGVVSDADLAALGLAKPIIFTVEGHTSEGTNSLQRIRTPPFAAVDSAGPASRSVASAGAFSDWRPPSHHFPRKGALCSLIHTVGQVSGAASI